MRHNPRAAQIVISIGEFMGREAPPPCKRHVVAEDTTSPADGRKLLETWLTIRSQAARQSVMDALVAIAERDPE